MNPILLKPMAGGRCQVIVKGRPYAVVEGQADPDCSREALAVVADCLADLRSRFEVVVLEGMGSPAEVNLRDRDVANMRAAALAEAPVLLVGDIERGGVFAALAGTMELLEPEDRRRVAGFLINKYHGDPAVLESGIDELRRRYGVPTLGVLPYLPDLSVAEEDAVALQEPPVKAANAGIEAIKVLVPLLPGIANFTDLDPLAAEPGIVVRYVRCPAEWEQERSDARATLVVLPGTRNTVADLSWLRETGLARCIIQHAAGGGWVVGLCGGYQMLGREIRDPEHVESADEAVPGLGLLDVVTIFTAGKQLRRVRGTSILPGLGGLPVEGYEIHHGRTERASATRPALQIHERLAIGENPTEGAVDAGGMVFGTYLHGLFDSVAFRRPFLRLLGWIEVDGSPLPSVFDQLADWLETHAAMDCLLSMLETS